MSPLPSRKFLTRDNYQKYHLPKTLNHEVQKTKLYQTTLLNLQYPPYCLWELSSYHHISKKILWKYYYATISIWSPTNSGVKISVSLKCFRIWNNICKKFLGFGSYWPVCLKKPKILKFSIQFHFETWTLKYQKSIFFKTVGLFGTWYEKMCPSYFWKTNS